MSKKRTYDKTGGECAITNNILEALHELVVDHDYQCIPGCHLGKDDVMDLHYKRQAYAERHYAQNPKHKGILALAAGDWLRRINPTASLEDRQRFLVLHAPKPETKTTEEVVKTYQELLTEISSVLVSYKVKIHKTGIRLDTDPHQTYVVIDDAVVPVFHEPAKRKRHKKETD